MEDEILAEGQSIAGVRALLAKAFRCAAQPVGAGICVRQEVLLLLQVWVGLDMAWLCVHATHTWHLAACV